ncbi:MAG: hypothetical protein AUK48_06885 [Oscillatoriales cyanobacterium CG2_30_44_21]|nr:MAG: hypothetical protein AUK48_06885 [Oscillatoriales cyanobacterium CG2_30_44_21]
MMHCRNYGKVVVGIFLNKNLFSIALLFGRSIFTDKASLFVKCISKNFLWQGAERDKVIDRE